MPANAVALVMDDAGLDRLACRAQNSGFLVGDELELRGVVSYHAARTLGEAQSVADWAERINEGLAPERMVPLRVTGRATIPLPGEPLRR